MPSQIMYLIRRLRDGTMRTVVSTSPRSAMLEFFVNYPGADKGEVFKIKARGGLGWDAEFKYLGCGKFRKVG